MGDVLGIEHWTFARVRRGKRDREAAHRTHPDRHRRRQTLDEIMGDGSGGPHAA